MRRRIRWRMTTDREVEKIENETVVQQCVNNKDTSSLQHVRRPQQHPPTHTHSHSCPAIWRGGGAPQHNDIIARYRGKEWRRTFSSDETASCCLEILRPLYIISCITPAPARCRTARSKPGIPNTPAIISFTLTPTVM